MWSFEIFSLLKFDSSVAQWEVGFDLLSLRQSDVYVVARHRCQSQRQQQLSQPNLRVGVGQLHGILQNGAGQGGRNAVGGRARVRLEHGYVEVEGGVPLKGG